MQNFTPTIDLRAGKNKYLTGYKYRITLQNRDSVRRWFAEGKVLLGYGNRARTFGTGVVK